MSMSYLITFAVVPDQRARFLALLTGVLDAMRAESTFISATLHVDPANEHRFLLHETWADHQDVLDVQLKRPYRDTWHDALPDLLEHPREIEIWQPLRSDHKSISSVAGA